ncbi:ABC transporter substrate-binding protein [Gordoniibacillus kamchatkensis]|uniref:ABC transporter substrate-binding protein n=1 Tax=Gordoniibacillus kamchatkensis TaxID=1590651 RepID=UPI000A9886BB|nr:ABC transporter substrate-binding protein [Paenibacillus sp. VKM B-2647]
MKAVKRTSLALLTLTLSAGAVLAGCSSKNDASGSAPSSGASSGKQEKVTLDFWTFWGSTTRRPIIEKIISDFNASQDHIVVKHTYLPWGDIWTKELAQVAAGNPPDVIVNDISTVAQRAQKNQNTNLKSFIGSEDIKSRFFPELWNTTLYKGDAYALPFTTDTRVMFYNKALFKEAGLDPNKPPATWDELAADAKKLDKIGSDGKIERLGFEPNLAAGWDLFLVNSDGLAFVDDKGAHINTPSKIDALNYIKSWEDRLGKKNLDAFQAGFGSKQNDPFISGKLAIKIDVGTFWTQIRDFYPKKEDIGIAPLPEFKPGTGHNSVGGGFVVEIPKGAKHPKESYEFMKYLTDVAAQKYWAQYNFDNVANIQASNDPELQKDPVYKATVDNLKYTKVTPVPLNAPDFRNLLNPEVDAVLLGKESPKDALDKAQAAVENLMKQNTK